MRISYKIICAGIGIIPMFTIISLLHIRNANSAADLKLNQLNKRLTVFHEQLEGLGVLLKEYKTEHKNYPTNNEGLVNLNQFDSLHQIFILIEYDDIYKNFGIRWRNDDNVLKQFINHQKSTWLLPKPKPDLFLGVLIKESNLSEYIQYTMGIRNDGIGYILGSIGPVDRWSLMPYLYENRNGLASSALEGSVINNDNQRNYSIIVDEGIYVYSIAAMSDAHQYNQLEKEIEKNKILSFIIIIPSSLLFIILFLKLFISDKKRTLKYVAILIAIDIVLIVVITPGKYHPTMEDYCFGRTTYIRTPGLVNQQKEMLDLYRKNNVINQETYDKQIAALELTPTVDVEAEK